jgi:hypothetical protein
MNPSAIKPELFNLLPLVSKETQTNESPQVVSSKYGSINDRIKKRRISEINSSIYSSTKFGLSMAAISPDFL